MRAHMQERIEMITLEGRTGSADGLSPEEAAEILAGLSQYPDNQAMSIEALKIVQHHRGWVSNESLKAVAAFLRLSPEEVEGVATFYNLVYRQRVGTHVVRVCDSVSCWIMGCEALVGELQNKLQLTLGETTADGRFTLLPGPCMGACDHAPVVMVGDDYHFDVKAEAIDALLKPYRQKPL
ncbi:NADH dehydrogenase I, chain E [gamma proteobacterium HdN1]|nr:NADH dehydrogenase I, chain E [gamma proteobacterium HdN1]